MSLVIPPLATWWGYKQNLGGAVGKPGFANPPDTLLVFFEIRAAAEGSPLAHFLDIYSLARTSSLLL